ncbi:MAG: long-chain-acyl-CoA synthetase [Candidatus Binatia bacterium]|nr:MAG: long-chain-acyl-CoA synthetase [Candidatus Binatia bacterium]
MNWRLLWEDLRELPVLFRLGRALQRCGPEGRETLGVLAQEQAARFGDRPFLLFEREPEAVTFGQYNAQVNRWAWVFRQAGISAREPVAILMENSPAFLFAEGAVAKRGAIGALLNTHLRGEPLAHVLRISGARHVFVDEACLPALVDLPEAVQYTIWSLGDRAHLPPHVEPLEQALAAADSADPPLPDVRGKHVFLYIYTSGTTGLPKAAIVRHARFMMGGLGLSALLGIGQDDVMYAPLPLYHGESNFVGFAVALRAGAGFASRRRFSASGFLDDVRRHGATAFVYVGELCRYLLRQPPRPDDRNHRLRLAVGAGLRPDIWEAFQKRFGIARIVEMYGATEGNIALINLRGRVGAVGRAHPFQHHRYKLARYDVERGELLRGADGFLVECKVGEPGELLGRISSRGPMPYDGYTDREASERKVVRNAFRHGDAYFRSGDLLRRDEDFYYYFVDRIGDTFRWKGENVATQEVASILNRAPGVSETNVYGVAVPGHEGRAGMAAVVLQPGASFDGKVFYATAEQLPGYARPVFVRIVPEMDVTGTLKQRKVELQRQGYDPNRIQDPLFIRDDAARAYVPLTPEIYQAIASGARKL